MRPDNAFGKHGLLPASLAQAAADMNALVFEVCESINAKVDDQIEFIKAQVVRPLRQMAPLLVNVQRAFPQVMTGANRISALEKLEVLEAMQNVFAATIIFAPAFKEMLSEHGGLLEPLLIRDVKSFVAWSNEISPDASRALFEVRQELALELAEAAGEYSADADAWSACDLDGIDLIDE